MCYVPFSKYIIWPLTDFRTRYVYLATCSSNYVQKKQYNRRITSVVYVRFSVWASNVSIFFLKKVVHSDATGSKQIYFGFFLKSTLIFSKSVWENNFYIIQSYYKTTFKKIIIIYFFFTVLMVAYYIVYNYGFKLIFQSKTIYFWESQYSKIQVKTSSKLVGIILSFDDGCCSTTMLSHKMLMHNYTTHKNS